MTTRGKVLREPGVEAGLLMIQGQQYRFGLDGLWKSPVAPQPGLTVDVDWDQNGHMSGITVIPESQLNKERAEAALARAKEKGGEMLAPIVAQAGKFNLIAVALLLFGWYFLTSISIQMPIGGSEKFTFWQVLGLVNAGNILEAMQGARTGAGVYGLLAFIVLVTPFLHLVWKDKRAILAGITPLLFMVLMLTMARHTIAGAFTVNLGGGVENEFTRQARSEALSAISFGFGTYWSFLASLYFAAVAVKQFLQTRATALPRTMTAPASMIIAICAALVLTGCFAFGNPLQGVYYDQTGGISLDLKSGGDATFTFAGESSPCTYTVKGEKLTVACKGDAGTTVFTIRQDGSLAPPPGALITALQKRK